MQKTDTNRVMEAVRGDKQAINDLVTLFYNDMLYFAISKVGVQAGEEVAQQSALLIITDIAKLREPEKFQSWMMSIVHHRCMNYLRRKKRTIDLFTSSEAIGESLSEQREFSPEEYVDSKENQLLVKEVLAEMRPAYSDCLQLYYCNEMEYEEIAAALGMTHNMVRNNLHRGRIDFEKRMIQKIGVQDAQFVFGAAPAGAFPILTKFYEADMAATITPDMLMRGSQTIQSGIKQLGSQIVKTGMQTGTKVMIGVVSVSAVSLILGLSGLFGGQEPEPQASLPAMVQTQTTTPEPTPTPLPSPTPVPTEAPIITVADMIGEDEAEELAAFENGLVDEAAWRDFLERIGAQVERVAEEYDYGYVLYLLQKQDKQLILAERKEVNGGEIKVVSQFGVQEELAPLVEYIMMFD